jgi:putative glutamine amidotransferase
VVTARAPDGVIEGLEIKDSGRPHAPFAIGVQWHPENLAATDPQMLGLFQAFVRAAAKRQFPVSSESVTLQA